MTEKKSAEESVGIPIGVPILLYGPVGSGKTTFSLRMAKEFLGRNLPLIWVCLDESPLNIRKKLSYFGVDNENLEKKNLVRYVDVYTEYVTGKALDEPYVLNCSSVSDLTEVNIALNTARKELKGGGLLVVDSVSTLLLYTNADICEKFLRITTGRFKSDDYTGLFILQKGMHSAEVEETMKMIADAVMGFEVDKGSWKVSIIKKPLTQKTAKLLIGTGNVLSEAK